MCYNRDETVQKVQAEKGGSPMSPTDWLWKVFEVTGSPDAYLLYRHFLNDLSGFEQVINKTL